MEHEANWSLEGDGLVENLFYYLWCKDEFGGGPSLLIPDTIVYKFTQPAFWYFTSKSGKVKKKAKGSLANVQIEREFCRKLCGVDIVAYYIYMLNDVPTIEYFNVEGLKDFLYTRQKIHNGVLQRFIVPKGSANSLIRAIWTPKMCLLERKTNVRRLHDLRYGIYERAVTFDGADAYSNPDPVRGSILPGDIQYLCEQVVDHVMEVSFHKYRISRMVLHIKTDANDKVWLLWSSSIRLARSAVHETHKPAKPIDITYDAQVPSFVHLNCMPDGKPSSKLKVFVQCHSCAKSMDAAHAAAVTYKAILEHFHQLLHAMRQSLANQSIAAVLWPPDHAIIDAAGGVGFGILAEMDDVNPAGKPITETDVTIPPVLRFLHPHLPLADFRRFVHDPVFLFKTATVCHDCYLVYADYSTSALEVNTLRQEAPAILRPHREIPPLQQKMDRVPESAWMLPPSSSSKVKHGKQQLVKSQYVFKDPPALPARIDHTLFEQVERHMPVELKFAKSQSAPTLPLSSESSSGYFPTEWKTPPSMVPDPAHEPDQTAKEDNFFKELSASSMVLEAHHPLRHMIESAQKLSNVEREMLLADPRTAGSVAKKAKAPKNPYTVVQTLREDAMDKKRRNMPRLPTKKIEFNRLAPTDEERVTSTKHREFLLQSLHDIQREIAAGDSLQDVMHETTIESAEQRYRAAQKQNAKMGAAMAQTVPSMSSSSAPPLKTASDDGRRMSSPALSIGHAQDGLDADDEASIDNNSRPSSTREKTVFLTRPSHPTQGTTEDIHDDNAFPTSSRESIAQVVSARSARTIPLRETSITPRQVTTAPPAMPSDMPLAFDETYLDQLDAGHSNDQVSARSNAPARELWAQGNNDENDENDATTDDSARHNNAALDGEGEDASRGSFVSRRATSVATPMLGFLSRQNSGSGSRRWSSSSGGIVVASPRPTTAVVPTLVAEVEPSVLSLRPSFLEPVHDDDEHEGLPPRTHSSPRSTVRSSPQIGPIENELLDRHLNDDPIKLLDLATPGTADHVVAADVVGNGMHGQPPVGVQKNTARDAEESVLSIDPPSSSPADVHDTEEPSPSSRASVAPSHEDHAALFDLPSDDDDDGMHDKNGKPDDDGGVYL
ncbi:Aste57867_20115 [Aphanomyces stellatus]|uniref:Aste57867_20115 protein n=1 Tax=Aphanomyces stellatus TaxID=120398 RepID=A0A485LEX5_9STRA|nr:hypothetical protein As57867_020049 [Aphanomyces stellatus]VFT96810.1 Aste57867_20115 [Aphanomyces stellatus]